MNRAYMVAMLLLTLKLNFLLFLSQCKQAQSN